MQPLDWAKLLELAPNLGIAVAFGFFVLRLLDRQDRQNDKRDNEWRTFLTESREQYTTTVGSWAGEVRKMSDLFQSTHSLLEQHDTWERSEWASEHAERAAAILATAKAVETAAQVTHAVLRKAEEGRKS